jgi:hypothetical protein
VLLKYRVEPSHEVIVVDPLLVIGRLLVQLVDLPNLLECFEDVTFVILHTEVGDTCKNFI